LLLLLFVESRHAEGFIFHAAALTPRADAMLMLSFFYADMLPPISAVAIS